MCKPCAVFRHEWFVFGKGIIKTAVCVCVAGSVRVVRGEGMPHYRNPFEKGDLFIKFEVQFPENKWISPEKLTVSRMMDDRILRVKLSFLHTRFYLLKFS